MNGFLIAGLIALMVGNLVLATAARRRWQLVTHTVIGIMTTICLIMLLMSVLLSQ